MAGLDAYTGLLNAYYKPFSIPDVSVVRDTAASYIAHDSAFSSNYSKLVNSIKTDTAVYSSRVDEAYNKM